MNKYVFKGMAFCAFAMAMVSCADKDLTDNNRDNEGAAVGFYVEDVQQLANNADAQTATRALHASYAEAAAFAPQQLEAYTTDGTEACLVETTVPGVCPVKRDVQTRGAIEATLNADFSVMGYRGKKTDEIADKPNYLYAAKTKPDGTLYEPAFWARSEPYARFYAAYPNTDNKDDIVWSDKEHKGAPYITFKVADNVRQQKDLMTACTGVVHYETYGTAPKTSLAFRHALTAVKFAVGDNLSWNKRIVSIALTDVCSTGRYTLSENSDGSGAKWDAQGAPKTFTLSGLNISTSQAVNAELTSGDATFLMIPQKLTGKGIKAVVTFSDGTTLTSQLKGEWQAGTTKTYKISHKKGNWEYVFTVTPALDMNYNEEEGKYTVTSYRQQAGGAAPQEPVKWELVGYDGNNDGKYTLEAADKPEWLKSMSLTSGDGGTAAEEGTAKLDNTFVDLAKQRNQKLQSTWPVSDYDLSRYDLDGNPTKQNTANCYVVWQQGPRYRIPLVYGNGIKDGEVNTDAFVSKAADTYVDGRNVVLRRFKDYLGNDITNPYIAETYHPVKAQLIWGENEPGSSFMTYFQIHGTGKDAYIQFHAPRPLTCGNYIVGIFDALGRVIWSWHIWITDKSSLDKIKVQNHSGKTYYFSKETLGWKYTKWHGVDYEDRSVKALVRQKIGHAGAHKEAVITITQKGSEFEGVSTLYQWGRKDAFPGTSDLISSSTFVQNGGNNMSLMNGIQHPGTFYSWGSSWFGDASTYRQYNLWSANNNATGYNDDNPVKTIYDPCPVGFKVPPSNAFTGFTRSGENAGNNTADFNNVGKWHTGYTFPAAADSPIPTLHFPAAGVRGAIDGKLDNVGRVGYYWTASPLEVNDASGKTRNGCAFIFYNQINPKATAVRPYGMSIRPIADE